LIDCRSLSYQTLQASHSTSLAKPSVIR